MPVSMHPDDATCGRPLHLHVVEYHDVRYKTRISSDAPLPRRHIRDFPGLIQPLVYQYAAESDKANLSQTYAAMLSCGTYVLRQTESFAVWSKRKGHVGDLGLREQAFLHNPFVLPVRGPWLTESIRDVTVTIDHETTEKVEELAGIWSMGQTQVLRSAVIAAVSQERRPAHKKLAAICRFELEWIEKQLMLELGIRNEIIELSRKYPL